MEISDKPTPKHTAVIALGSNQGNPQLQIAQAINYLSNGGIPYSKDHKNIPSEVCAISSLYRTKPVGYLNQPDFINAVVVMKTELNKYELLESLHILENAFGRERSFPNAPRTLDLDIITYDNDISNDPRLILPHPRAFERAFVLIPLVEIAPSIILQDGKTAQEWLKLVDTTGVDLIKTVKKKQN